MNGTNGVNGTSGNKRTGKHKTPELEDLSKIFTKLGNFILTISLQIPSLLRGLRIAERWTPPTERSSSSSCSAGTVSPSRTGPKSAST